jgi:hypothetical protein
MTTTNQGEEPRILEALRLTEEQIDKGSTGETGLKRAQKAAHLGEDHGFRCGWDAKTVQMEEEAEAAQELAELAAAVATDQGYKDEDYDDDNPEFLRGLAIGLAQAAFGEVPDPLVPCKSCNGTGKMPQWGSQCKTCFGATKVRASTLVTEEEPE